MKQLNVAFLRVAIVLSSLAFVIQTATAEVANLIPSPGVPDGAYTSDTYNGRAVWLPANYLYFNVPGTFPLTPGQPVYVRIEYDDTGRGRLAVQYDSTLGSFYRNAEIHSRSSRVGVGGFVDSYQCFQAPRFAGGQNGGNDFRLRLSGTDGTPLRIASVQISTAPYSDAQFSYALSQPWLVPPTGPVKDFTDNQTVMGKVMAGYQGWFAVPNDPDDLGWRHWGRSSGIDPSPSQITVDMWPWLDEYNPDQVYPAGAMVHQDGRPAYLFSSRDLETVHRHFRWMREHNIDGVYLQRFVSKNSGGHNGNPEFVLANVRKAAAAEGRVWALEYDVSGLDGNETTRADIPYQLEVITNDWNYLVNQCGILDDPRYLHENGKPVLFIWGFGTGNNISTAAEADPVISWFTNQNLYLIGGVSKGKLNDANWQPVLKKYDQLLEWMEPDLPDLIARRQQLQGFGMKILPHAWPGFSWNNLKQTVFPYQYTARNGGAFYWTRIYNAVSCGADQLFLGMFDEYDEGTAIMPMSDNHPDIYDAGGTNTWGHYLDNEGRDPFWYLRLSGAAREMLNGQRALTSTLPLESALTPVAYGGDDATVYLGATDITDSLTHIQWADGPTSGLFLGNHDCRTNANLYFYFKIDDAFCSSNTGGQAATVEIEYYDNTPGTIFKLQYDSLTAAYALHPTIVTAPATGGWKNIRWNVADGFFGNRQNGGADFRIALNAGKVAAIRRVSVFLPEEQTGDVVADAPRLGVVNEQLAWPALSDATGWRLFETTDLSSTNWQEVAGPFIFANGMVYHDVDPPSADSAAFFRLMRPPRQ